MIYTFKDFYKNIVRLSFEQEPFTKTPKHVLIICKFDDRWLLTEHPTRGIEFPGGKVEECETCDEAAVREVMEETGGKVSGLEYVAQYCVKGKRETIFKNVYFADIHTLTDEHFEFETLGPLLMEELPDQLKQNKRYSFIMKDDVLVHCLAYLKRKKKLPLV